MNPLAFLVVLLLLARNVADAKIGVDWGRQNAQKLLPSNVVDLLLQNGIQQARIFTSEEDIIQAFVGSGIELTLTVTNVKGIDTYEKAKNWIMLRQKYFVPSNIRRINVADYVFSNGFDNSGITNALQALQNLQQALNDAKYGDQIKATIPALTNVLKMNKTSLRPSETEFRDEIKQEMAILLRILKQNNAPFTVGLTPFLNIQELGVDFNFALYQNSSSFVVKDINGAVYTNVFELMYDAFVWSLIKLNASDVEVVVGGVGWPTDGFPGANTTTAEQFFKWLLPWVSSNKGTPMRPGAPIDIFIHSLTDENQMPYYYSATFTRHFGIYRSNGKPKFKIDLSGKGRDTYPSDATGIMRMPERWCVFNGNRTDSVKVMDQLTKACSKADCTTLAPGASCSHLDFNQNVSYAFNMHFQFQFQNESECNFEGLGYVSLENPSTPGCVFPVEVVKAQRGIPYSNFSTGKGFHERPNRAIFAFFISILGALFWNL